MTKPISRKMAVDCLLYRTRGHVFCGICRIMLNPGDNIQFDHIHADVFDGPHEYQNLRPVHIECHKEKSARDVKDNAKTKRLANPKPSRHPMQKTGRKIPSRSWQTKKPPG